MEGINHHERGGFILKEKFIKFMTGRNGMDQLGQFSLGVAIFIMIIGLFYRSGPWNIIALVILFFGYFRMFSKNIQKRYQENQFYLKYQNKVKGWFLKQKSYFAQRKTHHIYSCPSCRQKIRIPKGKGKISIHCPKCGTDFIKKS